MMQTQIAIFASGRGTNADNIAQYFERHTSINVNLVVSNRASAGVFAVAQKWNIPALHIPRSSINDENYILAVLENSKIDYIILAGFMLLVPSFLVSAYPNKIMNIHPALLPKYGGQGMYGHHVHEAIIANKESETGITIHYVNEAYDEGQIIFQATCPVESSDNTDAVASKVHTLEYAHYPKVIESVILDQAKK